VRHPGAFAQQESMTAADMNAFLPTVLQAMEVHGKVYYLKYEMEPLALYYAKKLFAEKGLKRPRRGMK
jgi:ABC-type glycerol-3-phosphate transport system substrate-binding protein